MNARRCLSFQTQDKGMMDLEFRKKLKQSFMAVISVKFAALIIRELTIL